MQARGAEMLALRQEAEKQGIEVFGEGNLNARLALVGEAPGKVEVERGRPFQGPAGWVLDELLDRLADPARGPLHHQRREDSPLRRKRP